MQVIKKGISPSFKLGGKIQPEDDDMVSLIPSRAADLQVRMIRTAGIWSRAVRSFVERCLYMWYVPQFDFGSGLPNNV